MNDISFHQLWGYPRTRCDPGEGPLWCLVMGGPSATEYHVMRLQLAAAAAQRQMQREPK